jgi:hypothetical protein
MEGSVSPKEEFKDLRSRLKRLTDAALLFIITAALLLVAAGTLFFSVFVTTFTMGRNTIDRTTARVAVERGAALHVL